MTRARLLAALALSACGGSVGPSTPGGSSTGAADESTSAAPATTTTDAVPTSTGDDGGTTTGDTGDTAPDPVVTTAGDASTGDPCAACDPHATCEADACVCADGWAGDGQTCADVDECSEELDACDPAATCTNQPGTHACACESGYSGDGATCTDIDECAEGLDECDVNATCTNLPGLHDCTCNEGYTGDGKTCHGDEPFGEACAQDGDCASYLCLPPPNSHCSIPCTQGVANDCGAQDVTGLCIALDMDVAACAGTLSFGDDPDDALLAADMPVMRTFQDPDDADVFLLDLPAGEYLVAATPDPDDDIQLELYGGDAAALQVLNAGGPGVAESGVVVHPGGVFFAVVRDIGASTGKYTIAATPQ